MGAFRGIRDLRIVLGLFAWCTILVGPAGSTSFGPFELPVTVEEQPGLVRLYVLLPEAMAHTSINVVITERKVVVLGRYPGGLPLRSRPIHLSQTVSAEGVEMRFADDGSLVITLQAGGEGGS